MKRHQQLNEGLQIGDLEYLVDDRIHFDEYNSKMGQPEDIVTMSFKVRDIMPATDLVSFLENGYDWVLDADVSSGEVSDNNRLVFVEMQRNRRVFEQVDELLRDLDHLTGVKPDQWRFRWLGNKEYQQMSEENFKKIIPQTPSQYTESLDHLQIVEEETNAISDDLEVIRKLSGIA
jgi:hypothetical protein